MQSFVLQIINLLFLWWPGVELNHRHADFQSGERDSSGLLVNHLQRLLALFPGTPRHNHGTLNLSSTHSWLRGISGDGIISGLLMGAAVDGAIGTRCVDGGMDLPNAPRINPQRGRPSQARTPSSDLNSSTLRAATPG
jgi:hypothetical protein